ncbi:hypothetical protein QBC34DRAFT_383161 [Podospora aff. communis PSN243]|uniref:F-box domain-containing protein n=1 Tax=Podospora aff. communis PSN243 TaxID=3040156 RepID=A0AAV9GF30_9PEZI|nr:hypothetical protein QBC34DRAFT_383161 [Podospora aff. communis PSN243]
MASIFNIEDIGPTPFRSPPLPLAHLEWLPAEIRCLILTHIDDLEDLKALVFASPAYHQQYLLDRGQYLSQKLKTTLGSTLVDAYALQRCITNRLTTATAIRAFYPSYVDLRALAKDSRFHLEDHTTEQDCIDMAGLYLAWMRSVPEMFANLFLQNLMPSGGPINLSSTERARLLRASYRFQLYAVLFGATPLPDAPTVPHEKPRASEFWLSDRETMKDFLRIFPPWEIEEIHSLLVCMRHKIGTVLDAVRPDFHRDHPRFAGHTDMGTPPGAWDLGSYYTREYFLHGLPSRGLQVFHQIVNAETHAKLIGLLDTNFASSYAFFEEALDGSFVLYHTHEESDVRSIEFVGDKEAGPPLAWVMVTKGKFYEEACGPGVPVKLKECGCVFWDSGRLTDTKANEMVEQEAEDWY